MLCPICGLRHGSAIAGETLEDLDNDITFYDQDAEEVCDECTSRILDCADEIETGRLK